MLTRPTYAVNNIQTLADVTKDQATAVKVLHDKTGADNKAYLENVLLPELDEKFSIPEGGAAAMAISAYNGSNPAFVALSEDVANMRKLEFKLNASPYWLDGSGNARSQEYIYNDLLEYVKMGVDGLTVCCHVYNNSGTLYVAETLANTSYAITTADSLGIPVTAIKMHCTQSVFDAEPSSFTQYLPLINSIIAIAQNTTVEHFTVLNEVPNIYYSAVTATRDFVISLLNAAKNAGFKTGITCSGESDLYLLKSNTWLLPYIDCFYVNFYNSIGYKAVETTQQDSIYAWDTLKTAEMLNETYSKEVVISESGVQHYWECLANPAQYDWSGYTQTDGQGEVAKTYFYGLFNSIKLNQMLSEVWLWYPEQMHYTEFYNFVRRYTK